MASVSFWVGSEERASRVERVGVTDGSSLVVVRVRLCWFVLRVFLVLCASSGRRADCLLPVLLILLCVCGVLVWDYV